MEIGLADFLAAACGDPMDFLGAQPLAQLIRDAGNAPEALAPGKLISVWPPFVAEESAGGNVSLRPVPALELRRFHADFAASIRGMG